MAIIRMPKMGDTMQEGTISKWYKAVGDEVKEGDVIAEIETEKAAIEIEAYESGPLTKIIVGEGETVPVGEPIAELGGSGAEASAKETTAAPQPAGNGGAKAPSAPPPAAQPSAPSAPSAPPPAPAPAAQQPVGPPPGQRVIASPLARRMAHENHVDLWQISGTGPGGRIIAEDVTAYVQGHTGAITPPETVRPAAPAPQAPAPAAAPQPVPLGDVWQETGSTSKMRQIIARRLTESKQQIPHFYVTFEVDMKPAMDLRQLLNARGDEFVKLSPNDLIVKALADALRAFPAMRKGWGGNAEITTERVNIGVAVAMPQGLIVPVVRDADRKSLNAVAQETRALVEKARAGKLLPDEYAGGTFTVTNMGMYGVDDFSAIINPPEPGILAVSAIKEKPVIVDGQIAVGTRMNLTLSVDHRVIDGAVAAQFTQELKKRLENPLLLLQ